MNIVFIDTSVLCNILEIPKRSDEKEQVMEELDKLKQDRNVGLIIPLAAIIETGNHIAHIDNGNSRRIAAVKLNCMISDMLEGKTPWRYYGREMEDVDLKSICEKFEANAHIGISFADESIIHAYEQYKRDTPGIGYIKIWSLDSHLQGYDEKVAVSFSRNGRR